MSNSKCITVWDTIENAEGEAVLSSTWRDASTDWWLSAAVSLPEAAERVWGEREPSGWSGSWERDAHGAIDWSRSAGRPKVWADRDGVHVAVGVPAGMAQWEEAARSSYWLWAWSAVHGELRELASD